MRHLILSAIILLSPAVILLTACNPWQYMTINSAQLTHNDYNQLVYENDTMRLIYDIGGNDGQATLRILNKTGQPLTVNWRKSAFIRNQESIGFYGQDIIVHGHTISRSRYNRDFVASFMLPDSVDFIPPGSGIAKTLPTLASTGPLQIDLPDSLPQKKLAGSSGFNAVNYKQLHYDETNTPIRFMSYLTFSIGHDNMEFSVTNRFYVSEVYLADGRPETFTLYHGRGDQIYIRSKMSNPAVGEGQPTASSNIR